MQFHAKYPLFDSQSDRGFTFTDVILVKIPRSAFYYLKGLNVTVIFIDVIISKAEVVMIVKITSLSFKHHMRIDSITVSFYLHVNKNSFAVSFFFPIRSLLVIHSLTEILLSY